MQYKGIIFFDYDGTLTEESKGIFFPTPSSIDAINKAVQNGYLAVLATGRSMCYVPDMGINFGGYIAANGAYSEIGGHVISNHYVDKKLQKEFIKKADEMGLYYGFEDQKKGYAKDIGSKLFCDVLDNFKIPFSVFENIKKGEVPNTSKIIVAYNNADDHEILSRHFKDSLTIAMHRKSLSADIQEMGIHKGVGAKAIAEHLNIPKDKCYAFGDGTNDVELFETVGHPIAMGYHASELDELCEYVTENVENEGVMKGLMHYGLI